MKTIMFNMTSNNIAMNWKESPIELSFRFVAIPIVKNKLRLDSIAWLFNCLVL